MNKLLRFPCALLAGLVFLSACNNDDPEPENQEELITTVRLTFTPAGGGTPVVATWQDQDGDGGGAPVVSAINLARNTTYTLAVTLLDESKTPDVDITTEVAAEAEEHQLFFRTTGLSGMTIAYNDKDGNDRPIGLSNTVTTPTAGAGTLTVILRHEPNKAATGVAAGDPTNAGGETDIETTPPFTVTVQ
ncbi:MAG: type 1 periplasmic binding fold superfamily protein [Cytophagales bacterium]|nr:type 1 periplasmic binding fold superfamily protein [Cytophagales bacterium]